MEVLSELTLLCTGVENVYLCVYLLSWFCFKTYTCVRGLGEKVGRTLVCTLLVLEVMKVEKHVGSGPVVVSVLKNTNRF